MSLPSVGNRNIDSNFNAISKEIDALRRAVNARQEGSTQGLSLANGDIRFIKGTDGSGYLEVGGKDGVYTTFQGGFQLKGTDTPYAYLHKLSVDNFYAKNIFAQSIRTTNGNLILSDSGIVGSATGSTSFTVKNPDGTLLNPFVVGDLLYTAKFGADHSVTIKELRLDVTAVSGLTVTYTKSSESATGIPAQVGSLAAGDVLVRLGNNNLATYPERGAVMLLATSDRRDMGAGVKNFAPYVKMLSLINSYADYFNGQPIAMLGNLGTVTDVDFPVGSFLSPSTGTIGLYTAAGFFKGSLSLSDGDILGGIALGKVYKSASDPSATSVIKEGDLWIDSSAANRFKTQVWIGNPSDHVSPGAWQAYLPGIWDAPSGSGLQITSNYMGYYSGGAFQTYIRDNGSFYFAGYDANHYITWDGTSAELTIAGKVMITNEQNFVKNPVTYVQAADPKLSVTVYEGTLWCDSDGVPVKWYKWIGANSAYSSPGNWEEQPWGTYITGGGIYTGSLTAGQVTAGTFTGLTFQTDTGAVGHYKRVEISAATNSIIFYDSSNNNCGGVSGVGSDIVLGGNLNMETAQMYGAEGSLQFSLEATGGLIASGNDGLNWHRAQITGGALNFGLDATYDVTLYRSAANMLYTPDGFTANSLVKIGGTSSQFLKADGSVDSTAYVSGTPWTAVGYMIDPGSVISDKYLMKDAFSQTLSWADVPSGMTYPGAGIALSTGSAWGTSITNNSANWNTAYGWGNHASAGYQAGLGIVDFDADSLEILFGGHLSVKVVADSGLTETSGLAVKGYTATGITVNANGVGINAGNGLGNSANQLVALVTAPLTFTTGSISMPAAATAQNGYLTSTDWNTFNGKATAAFGTPDVTDIEIAKVGGGSVILTAVSITINGTAHTFYMIAE